MKSLEEEAIEFSIETQGYERESYVEAFIAGANSKWVQRQIIEAKLEGIQLAEDNMRGIGYRIMELEQKLKKLEDESKTDIKA
jgi:hypothetical protein